MSKLITVPPPKVAVVCQDGLDAYRREMVSLRVVQRANGDAILTIEIGAVATDLVLGPDERQHLAALLLVEAR